MTNVAAFENVSVDDEAVATQAEVTRLKFDYENKQIAYDSSKEALSRIENEYKINSSILAEKRWEAKKAKNWSEADALRDKLKSLGYEIKDTPSGYEIKKI